MDVFSKRYQNKNTSKAGYFPQCDNFWRRGICPKASGNKIRCKDCANRVWTKLTGLHIEADLQEASAEIVISSPTLGKYKVYRMIKLLKERQEAGVKITIVTWHPDAYKYGREEHRIELMEALRNAGFNIELVEASCEHYAVIDNAIVWYGSMNLLSKDDIEDNIMWVESKDIAAELLEMTFHKGNKLQEYKLPV